MNLDQLFAEYKEQLTKGWIEAALATYPQKSQNLIRTNLDPFTNPVGNMLLEAATGLIRALSGQEINIEDVKNALERLIKIRAVQTLSASQSVGIIYLLKPLLRQYILRHVKNDNDLSTYLELESRVDTLALLAFDLYVKDREIVAENRVKEIRNQYAELKRWAQKLNASAPLGSFVGCGNN